MPSVTMERMQAMSAPTMSATMSAAKAFQPPLKARPTSRRGLASAGVASSIVMVGSFPLSSVDLRRAYGLAGRRSSPGGLNLGSTEGGTLAPAACPCGGTPPAPEVDPASERHRVRVGPLARAHAPAQGVRGGADLRPAVVDALVPPRVPGAGPGAGVVLIEALVHAAGGAPAAGLEHHHAVEAGRADAVLAAGDLDQRPPLPAAVPSPDLHETVDPPVQSARRHAPAVSDLP